MILVVRLANQQVVWRGRNAQSAIHSGRFAQYLRLVRAIRIVLKSKCVMLSVDRRGLLMRLNELVRGIGVQYERFVDQMLFGRRRVVLLLVVENVSKRVDVRFHSML